jgi:hypothetical protein
MLATVDAGMDRSSRRWRRYPPRHTGLTRHLRTRPIPCARGETGRHAAIMGVYAAKPLLLLSASLRHSNERRHLSTVDTCPPLGCDPDASCATTDGCPVVWLTPSLICCLLLSKQAHIVALYS